MSSGQQTAEVFKEKLKVFVNIFVPILYTKSQHQATLQLLSGMRRGRANPNPYDVPASPLAIPAKAQHNTCLRTFKYTHINTYVQGQI